MSAEREGGIGSLAEEAAKLLAALEAWASDPADGGHGVPSDGVGSPFREFDGHIATDGAECRYCPLCRVIGAMRATSPEVRRHLSTAVSSLLQAASEMLATREDGGSTSRSGGGVERIDLTDDDDWEEED